MPDVCLKLAAAIEGGNVAAPAIDLILDIADNAGKKRTTLRPRTRELVNRMGTHSPAAASALMMNLLVDRAFLTKRNVTAHVNATVGPDKGKVVVPLSLPPHEDEEEAIKKLMVEINGARCVMHVAACRRFGAQLSTSTFVRRLSGSSASARSPAPTRPLPSLPPPFSSPTPVGSSHVAGTDVKDLGPVQSALDATAVSGKVEVDLKSRMLVGNMSPEEGAVPIEDEDSANRAFYDESGNERPRATQAMLVLCDPMDDSKAPIVVGLIPLFTGETDAEYEEWVDEVHRIMDEAGLRYIGSAGDGASVTEALYQKRCRLTKERPTPPDHYIGFNFDDGNMVYGELIRSKVRGREGAGAFVRSCIHLLFIYLLVSFSHPLMCSFRRSFVHAFGSFICSFVGERWLVGSFVHCRGRGAPGGSGLRSRRARLQPYLPSPTFGLPLPRFPPSPSASAPPPPPVRDVLPRLSASHRPAPWPQEVQDADLPEQPRDRDRQVADPRLQSRPLNVRTSEG